MPFSFAGDLTYRTQCSLLRSCEEACLQDRQELRVCSSAHESMCPTGSPLIGRTQLQGASEMFESQARDLLLFLPGPPKDRRELIEFSILPQTCGALPQTRGALRILNVFLFYKLFSNLESHPYLLLGSSSKSYFTCFLKIPVTFPDKSALLSFGLLC